MQHRATWGEIYQYVLSLTDSRATANTLSVFKASASHFAAKTGGVDPRKCPVLTRLIKGASKLNLGSHRNLRPFTAKNIMQFIAIARSTEEKRDWQTTAAVILSFLGFLRVSESVP